MAYPDTIAPGVAPTMSYRLDSPLRFDLQAAAFKADPLPTFAAMRAAGPVVPIRMPFVGRIWATTTHAADDSAIVSPAILDLMVPPVWSPAADAVGL